MCINTLSLQVLEWRALNCKCNAMHDHTYIHIITYKHYICFGISEWKHMECLCVCARALEVFPDNSIRDKSKNWVQFFEFNLIWNLKILCNNFFGPWIRTNRQFFFDDPVYISSLRVFIGIKDKILGKCWKCYAPAIIRLLCQHSSKCFIIWFKMLLLLLLLEFPMHRFFIALNWQN